MARLLSLLLSVVVLWRGDVSDSPDTKMGALQGRVARVVVR